MAFQRVTQFDRAEQHSAHHRRDERELDRRQAVARLRESAQPLQHAEPAL